jgi:prolyl oligopeptidase
VADPRALTPPPAARREDLVEVLHGITVADPYRWLEDGEAPEVTHWVGAQNRRTRLALDAPADRARWHERLVALLAAPVSTSARVAGPHVFALERGAGLPQFRLVVRQRDVPDDPGRTLLDPARVTGDDTAAIDWYHPAPDGRRVVFGQSAGGDERSVLRVIDVESGQHHADAIPDTRAASVAWLPDGSGFLYTRYPADDEYHRMVYRHVLGARWEDDELVWGDLPTPEAWPEVASSADGRFTLVTVSVGWSRSDLHVHDAADGTWRTLIAGASATTAARFDGDRLVAVTNLGAVRGRLVAIPLTDPVAPGDWTTLLPESDVVLEAVRPMESVLLLAGTRRGAAVLACLERDGQTCTEVELPEPGTVVGLDAEPSGEDAFVQLEGFTRPAALFRWSVEDGLRSIGNFAGGHVGLPRFTVRHEQFASPDGTAIGLFTIHRADAPPAVDTPAILTGYGGFAISESPAWSPLIAAWCEAGGLVAVAGLRGGYEEGEAWHEAGRREHKQNAFDDFHAAADHLVATGRTARDRLALRGGSNGGLLMGAALTQRPDLARAVHCAVPLLDMVRFPRFLIARLWVDEYGDPEVAEELAWLHAYSPYHHVRHGVCYPAVLLTTAEGDSRVDPLHARKMAAALQAATSCPHERPILLHQEERAGHGVGKPLRKQADEAADVLAFFSWQLGAPRP